MDIKRKEREGNMGINNNNNNNKKKKKQQQQ